MAFKPFKKKSVGGSKYPGLGVKPGFVDGAGQGGLGVEGGFTGGVGQGGLNPHDDKGDAGVKHGANIAADVAENQAPARVENVDVAEGRSLPTDPNPFQFLRARKTGSTYNCRIWPGEVREVLFKSAAAQPKAKLWTPTIGGTAMDDFTDWSLIELAMTANQWAVCKVETDSQNTISANPIIEAHTTVPNDTPSQPSVDGVGGVNGVYYFKLFQLVISGSDISIDQKQQSDIEIQHRHGFRNVGSGAKVLKQFDNGDQELDARSIVGTGGTTVTEGTDEITIDGSGHPWKVTGDTDGTVDIAAGFILGHYFDYSAANPDVVPASEGAFGPDNIVLGFGGEYAGGAGVAITAGTRYIYAEVPRNNDSSGGSLGGGDEYCEAWDVDTHATEEVEVLVELFDDIQPLETDIVSIVESASSPANYTASTGKAAVCIAKVTNTAGTVTVDKQYVTHNPTIFVPIVNAQTRISIIS